MSIPVQDASAVFSNAVVARYNDRVPATNFLQGFFTAKFVPTKNAKIKVKRNGRFTSKDVERYSDGRWVKFSKTDEKIFEPPFYHDRCSLGDHELYDNVVGTIAASNMGTPPVGLAALFQANLNALMSDIDEDMDEVKQGQYRSIEKQCAQVIRSGIVTLDSGDAINFGRQAASIVDLGAGNYWATGTVDPFKTLEDGCQWIVENGNSGATTFDGLFGATALRDMKNNDVFIEKANSRRLKEVGMEAPKRQRNGATWHGVVDAGEYMVNVWSYPQYITDPDSGASSKYLDDKEVCLIPEDVVLDLSFHLVPQVVEDGKIPQTSEFLLHRSVNQDKGSDEMAVKCAPLAKPVSIDRLYTVQVVA
jgi:hypothetical protein